MPENAAGKDVLFDQLMTASREAHATGCHEGAYHALTAAMHVAHCGDDAPRLHEVVREARRQIEWIDANAPEHRLSTNSAGRHEHPGVFRMLIRQAEAHAEMTHRTAHHHHPSAPGEQDAHATRRPA